VRLLILTHRIPYPPDKGDKIRSYHILKHLAKRHEIWVGSIIDDRQETKFVRELAEWVRGQVYARIRPAIKKVVSIKEVVRRRPISVGYFWSRRLQRQVDDLIGRCDFDVVLCYSSPMAEYLLRSIHRNGKLAKTATIMDLIDVDSYKWAQYAERSSGWKRWIYRYEAEHLADYERMLTSAFSHLLLVSEREKEIFARVAPTKNVSAMPNGVDLGFFHPDGNEKLADHVPTIVFTGVMDYWPNVEGVTWFVEEVFSQVRNRVPRATFDIVGSRPTAQVMKLQRVAGVRVTGYVEDIREYLRNADVCVAPLRVARGLQNKVLEAMAMGRPVVSTPEALEGIRAVTGKDIIEAATPETFAEAVIDLLKNHAKAHAVGRRARRCVEQYYSWERNLGILDEIIDRSRARVTTVTSVG